MSESMAQHVTRAGPGAEAANSDLSEKLNDWIRMAGPDGLFRTCGSCRQMRREGPAHCDRYNATPPIYVLLRGCEHHEDEAEAPY